MGGALLAQLASPNFGEGLAPYFPAEDSKVLAEGLRKWPFLLFWGFLWAFLMSLAQTFAYT